MQYVILDMEWNQSFSRKFVFRNSTRLVGEVVQMGAVKLDEQFQTLDTFKVLVAPKYYTQMNRQVTKLTGIRDEDLVNGLPFKEAYERFRAWCGEDFIFLTWGYDDIPILRSNMQIHGLEAEQLPETYNIQRIFDEQITKEKRQYALADAMLLVGEQPLEVHDALYDALNTALVCKHLDMKKGLEQYEGLKMARTRADRRKRAKEPILTAEPVLQEDMDASYMSKRSAISDRPVSGFACPVCGKWVECCNWIEQNSEKSVAVGGCGCGEQYLLRLKFTRDGDDMYTVRRVIYRMDEALRDYYRNKVARRDRRKGHRIAARQRKKEAAEGAAPIGI